MKQKKYKYEYLRLRGEYQTDPELVEDLNKFGDRGWELKGDLTCKHGGYGALFMREVIITRD